MPDDKRSPIPGKATIQEKDEHFIWGETVLCRDCNSPCIKLAHPFVPFVYRCGNPNCWLSA